MPHFQLPQGNPLLDQLPPALKAVLETLFPPDSLGIDPGSSLMPVAPILGTVGKVAPQGILSRLRGMGDDVTRPPGAPAPSTGFASPVTDAAGQLPPMQMGPKLPMPDGSPAFGHGMPEYVPVGGEAAFNALRQPNMGQAISNASPMRQTLDEITSEVGQEGLRELMKRPIPGRQVAAPPRMK